MCRCTLSCLPLTEPERFSPHPTWHHLAILHRLGLVTARLVDTADTTVDPVVVLWCCCRIHLIRRCSVCISCSKVEAAELLLQDKAANVVELRRTQRSLQGSKNSSVSL